MTEKQKALIIVFVISAISAINPPITKFGLLEIPPISFAFIRFLIASICILPFFIGRRKIKEYFSSLIPITLLSTGNIILFTLAMKLTTANAGLIIYAAGPAVTAGILYLFHKERLSILKTFGILIGFIGVALIVLLPIIEKGEKFSGNLLGNVLLFIGVLFFSLYTVSVKKFQKIYSPFEIMGVFVFATAIALFPLFLYELAARPNWWANVSYRGVIPLIYMVFLGTIINYIFHQYAIRHGGAFFLSLTFYIIPPFGFIVAYLLLGEQLTQGLIAGGALALLGVYFASRK